MLNFNIHWAMRLIQRLRPEPLKKFFEPLDFCGEPWSSSIFPVRFFRKPCDFSGDLLSLRFNDELEYKRR